MVFHALERHGVPLEAKLEQKPCRKEKLEGKLRMTVYDLIKGKVTVL